MRNIVTLFQLIYIVKLYKTYNNSGLQSSLSEDIITFRCNCDTFCSFRYKLIS
jgi:hypothetical protein